VIVIELERVAPEMVIVVWRGAGSGFAATFTVTLPLPEPYDGLTVHQLSLLDTVQEIFDSTLNELLPPADAKFMLEGLTVRTGAFCMTLTAVVTLFDLSVKVSIVDLPLLTGAESVICALPEPLLGV
jgi:hypothetical protein